VIEEALSRDSVEVGDVLLDRYRLVALIGEGGMSRVFKATDLGKTNLGLIGITTIAGQGVQISNH